jgi:hypothetical protein
MVALAILGNLDRRARIVFVRMDKRIREEVPESALHYCFFPELSSAVSNEKITNLVQLALLFQS